MGVAFSTTLFCRAKLVHSPPPNLETQVTPLSTIHIIIQFMCIECATKYLRRSYRPLYSLLVRVCNVDYYKQGMREFTTTNLKYSFFFTNGVSTMKLFHAYIIQNHLHSSNSSQHMAIESCRYGCIKLPG